MNTGPGTMAAGAAMNNGNGTPDRCVATIVMKDEGHALRAAGKVQKEMPQGTSLKFEHMKGDAYRIMLYCSNGRELVVQKYVRDTTPNLVGFQRQLFSGA